MSTADVRKAPSVPGGREAAVVDLETRLEYIKNEHAMCLTLVWLMSRR